jgi:hypothetical protein
MISSVRLLCHSTATQHRQRVLMAAVGSTAASATHCAATTERYERQSPLGTSQLSTAWDYRTERAVAVLAGTILPSDDSSSWSTTKHARGTAASYLPQHTYRCIAYYCTAALTHTAPCSSRTDPSAQSTYQPHPSHRRLYCTWVGREERKRRHCACVCVRVCGVEG